MLQLRRRGQQLGVRSICIVPTDAEVKALQTSLAYQRCNTLHGHVGQAHIHPQAPQLRKIRQSERCVVTSQITSQIQVL
jgi:hypothetical protein